MKKMIFVFLMIFTSICLFAGNLPTTIPIKTGKVIENLSMKSKIMKEDINYSVYLPPDYDSSERKYPVVYLLHGYTDNETAWVQFGEVNVAVDQGIANREIPPMIIVMPDAKVTFYINNYNGEWRYEDMFFEEFIPHIEKSYRIRAQKEFRGVAGLSMGGYGTFLYAMKHPDMFAACAPFSAATGDLKRFVALEQEEYDHVYGPVFGKGLKGDERITEHAKRNSVIEIAKTAPVEDLKKVKYYIDCGDDDFLIHGNCEVHLILKDRGVPHEFRIRDGAHNWTYWRVGIYDGLKFIGKSFHR